jgi:lipid II:glycine glycyltransferase (peptidoglycan interpeptide bridge formation enzyme)
LIANLPGSHFLQTWEWSQVKSQFGWSPLRRVWLEGQEGSQEWTEDSGLEERRVQAAALVLERAVPLGGFAARLRVLYAPKGPLLAWEDAGLRRRVLQDLRSLAQRRGAIFVKIDPDVPLGRGVPGQPGAQEDSSGAELVGCLQNLGWRFSEEQPQFRNTVQIDLRPEEDQLLANMKQKTRYNIRLAQRRGVSIRSAGLQDLDLLYRMYAETSVRDGFVIRDERYYQAVWTEFLQAGMAEALVAEVEGEAVAAVMVFRFAGKAWYFYGMSRPLHREKMPNYLLQWEAMRRAKAAGCRAYDLWGAPDRFQEEDPLWGVYRFKEGLGGQVVRFVGAWDLPVRRAWYGLYTQALPRLLDWMRRRGQARTRRSAGPWITP